MPTLKQLIDMCSGGEGRIVSTGDLNEHQIAEAHSKSRAYIDEDGFGYVFLPWTLTTSKDRKREADYFSRIGAMV